MLARYFVGDPARCRPFIAVYAIELAAAAWRAAINDAAARGFAASTRPRHRARNGGHHAADPAVSNPARMPPSYVERGAADVRGWLDDVQGVRLSEEQIKRLTPAQRLDYARRFDQSTMPAWRDPRG